jgi:uncharacterized protein YraI
MRHRSLFALAAFLFVMLTPGLASAAAGYTTGNVNMRAGPSTANPVITTIPAGAPVQIAGCLAGWSWCDTIYAGYRGWVAGAYLNAAWQGKVVPFVAYAPQVGVPVVVYNADVYGKRYHVGQPWYPRARVVIGPNHACVRGRFGNVACR